MKEYKIVNGTHYDSRTPDQVISVLESARLNRTRVHVCLGETDGAKVGRDWLEESGVHGYIGRSTGTIKVPLLIASSRSHGGGALLNHCVVRIRLSAGGGVLYQHPNYHYGDLEMRRMAEPMALPDGRILKIEILRDGKRQAAFEDSAKARRYVMKLGVRAPICM